MRGDGCVSVCPLSVCFALEMLGTFSAGVAVTGWCCHSNLWGLLLAGRVCPAADPQPVFVPSLTHSSLLNGLCVLVNLFGPLVSFQILCSSGGWRQLFLNNAVFFCADLAPPKGIRFSDVTDTSTTVHWGAPRVRVDSYQITYVPAHGGQYLCEVFIPHTDHNWCFFKNIYIL